MRLKTKTFSSRNSIVLAAPALVLSYFGVYVSVANRIMNMRKSMIVHEIAIKKMSFTSFFFTADRCGSIMLVAFMCSGNQYKIAIILPEL